MAYERYLIDLVELSKKLNINGKFKHLLIWVENLSKYYLVSINQN